MNRPLSSTPILGDISPVLQRTLTLEPVLLEYARTALILDIGGSLDGPGIHIGYGKVMDKRVDDGCHYPFSMMRGGKYIYHH